VVTAAGEEGSAVKLYRVGEQARALGCVRCPRSVLHSDLKLRDVGRHGIGVQADSVAIGHQEDAAGTLRALHIAAQEGEGLGERVPGVGNVRIGPEEGDELVAWMPAARMVRQVRQETRRLLSRKASDRTVPPSDTQVPEEANVAGSIHRVSPILGRRCSHDFVLVQAPGSLQAPEADGGLPLRGC